MTPRWFTANGILFEGATADAFETKLVATDQRLIVRLLLKTQVVL